MQCDPRLIQMAYKQCHDYAMARMIAGEIIRQQNLKRRRAEVRRCYKPRKYYVYILYHYVPYGPYFDETRTSKFPPIEGMRLWVYKDRFKISKSALSKKLERARVPKGAYFFPLQHVNCKRWNS